MNRLEYLSQFSNAVLTPELNHQPLQKHSKGGFYCSIFDCGQVSNTDRLFRENWCKEQLGRVGEFGATIGGANGKNY